MIPQTRMNRLLFLILILLLAEQVQVASASLSSSSISGVSSTAQDSSWGRFRGGRDIENEDSEEVDVEGDPNSSDLEDSASSIETKDAKSIENQTWDPPKQRLKLKSAFRLIQEMREEVACLAHAVTDEDNKPEVQETPVDKDVVEPSITTPIMVGGALAMEGQRKAKETDNTVLTTPTSIVVDANRVAPLSSRLLEEAGNDAEDTDEGLEASSGAEGNAKGIDVSKFWWPNVWTQQLSDLQNNQETRLDYDSEEESEQDAAEEMDFEEPTDQSDEEISSTNDAGAFDDMITDYQEEDRDEVQVEVIPIPPEATEDSIIRDDLFPRPSSDETKSFVSSGAWIPIDNIFTLGLASKLPVLRVSSKLRHIRKLSARATGLHGFMSGKPSTTVATFRRKNISSEDEERMKNIQKRLAEFDKVREGVVDATQIQDQDRRKRFGFMRKLREERQEEMTKQEALLAAQKQLDAEVEERQRQEEEAREVGRRMERVKEIDRLISEGQARLQDLVCEKDVLQRRLNPLFDYTSETFEVADDDDKDIQDASGTNSTIRIEASRKFKFPPDDLVQEYLEMTFSSRRIAKLNHTDLWQDSEFDDDDDESIGDDLLTPSADAFRLYQDESLGTDKKSIRQSGVAKRRGGGSWILRQTIGKGPSIGEKIGEVAETAAYKAVCAAVMSFLARLLSSLHGVNVMKHSDIRLVLEQAPDLPRVGEGIIPGSSSDYAEEAIKTVMRRKSKKGRKRSKYHAMEDSFVQRDAVTEMLLSHVQISAPLLKLFPLAWQRAFLGNIITLATAIMSDFFEGLQFQILGHSLTFAFAPITQEDMINHIGLSGSGFNSRRARAEEFEAAVRATAGDVSENLKFLDRWHERALGSGVLRTQIANLIARIVLTLTDEILTGARMDLWSSQAGGPRMLAGLEYRTTTAA